jgi:putative nucleotidyltransferase with HDIG domain
MWAHAHAQLTNSAARALQGKLEPPWTLPEPRKQDDMKGLTYDTRGSLEPAVRVYTQSESLRRHALAVEACMRYYARLFGEDEELWGVVGLLHDFDYERYPSLEEHPFRGMEILRERGAPEVIIRAVGAHANHTGIPRESLLERAIFACDEISGFVIAVALVKGRMLSAVTPRIGA